ncbi:hypothetical protein ACFQE1_05420 [Halobium palmae]|uniref:Uncharacterized protein n=1 Tax=Halobium palmae TaxID=1776492 RepID=A0ABD5RY07_9EURY
MLRRNHVDGRSSATESKFFLPAVVAPPLDGSRLERLRATLFDQFGGPRN